MRVWIGLDRLQAQLMKQTLVENGIECFADSLIDVFPAAGMGEIGLWVGKEDEARARALLEPMEEDMSARLDRAVPENETNSHG